MAGKLTWDKVSAYLADNNADESAQQATQLDYFLTYVAKPGKDDERAFAKWAMMNQTPADRQRAVELDAATRAQAKDRTAGQVASDTLQDVVYGVSNLGPALQGMRGWLTGNEDALLAAQEGFAAAEETRHSQLSPQRQAQRPILEAAQRLAEEQGLDSGRLQLGQLMASPLQAVAENVFPGVIGGVVRGAGKAGAKALAAKGAKTKAALVNAPATFAPYAISGVQEGGGAAADAHQYVLDMTDEDIVRENPDLAGASLEEIDNRRRKMAISAAQLSGGLATAAGVGMPMLTDRKLFGAIDELAGAAPRPVTATARRSLLPDNALTRDLLPDNRFVRAAADVAAQAGYKEPIEEMTVALAGNTGIAKQDTSYGMGTGVLEAGVAGAFIGGAQGAATGGLSALAGRRRRQPPGTVDPTGAAAPDDGALGDPSLAGRPGAAPAPAAIPAPSIAQRETEARTQLESAAAAEQELKAAFEAGDDSVAPKLAEASLARRTAEKLLASLGPEKLARAVESETVAFNTPENIAAEIVRLDTERPTFRQLWDRATADRNGVPQAVPKSLSQLMNSPAADVIDQAQAAVAADTNKNASTVWQAGLDGVRAQLEKQAAVRDRLQQKLDALNPAAAPAPAPAAATLTATPELDAALAAATGQPAAPAPAPAPAAEDAAPLAGKKGKKPKAAAAPAPAPAPAAAENAEPLTGKKGKKPKAAAAPAPAPAPAAEDAAPIAGKKGKKPKAAAKADTSKPRIEAMDENGNPVVVTTDSNGLLVLEPISEAAPAPAPAPAAEDAEPLAGKKGKKPKAAAKAPTTPAADAASGPAPKSLAAALAQKMGAKLLPDGSIDPKSGVGGSAGTLRAGISPEDMKRLVIDVLIAVDAGLDTLDKVLAHLRERFPAIPAADLYSAAKGVMQSIRDGGLYPKLVTESAANPGGPITVTKAQQAAAKKAGATADQIEAAKQAQARAHTIGGKNAQRVNWGRLPLSETRAYPPGSLGAVLSPGPLRDALVNFLDMDARQGLNEALSAVEAVINGAMANGVQLDTIRGLKEEILEEESSLQELAVPATELRDKTETVLSGDVIHSRVLVSLDDVLRDVMQRRSGAEAWANIVKAAGEAAAIEQADAELAALDAEAAVLRKKIAALQPEALLAAREATQGRIDRAKQELAALLDDNYLALLDAWSLHRELKALEPSAAGTNVDTATARRYADMAVRSLTLGETMQELSRLTFELVRIAEEGQADYNQRLLKNARGVFAGKTVAQAAEIFAEHVRAKFIPARVTVYDNGMVDVDEATADRVKLTAAKRRNKLFEAALRQHKGDAVAATNEVNAALRAGMAKADPSAFDEGALLDLVSYVFGVLPRQGNAPLFLADIASRLPADFYHYAPAVYRALSARGHESLPFDPRFAERKQTVVAPSVAKGAAETATALGTLDETSAELLREIVAQWDDAGYAADITGAPALVDAIRENMDESPLPLRTIAANLRSLLRVVTKSPDTAESAMFARAIEAAQLLFRSSSPPQSAMDGTMKHSRGVLRFDLTKVMDYTSTGARALLGPEEVASKQARAMGAKDMADDLTSAVSPAAASQVGVDTIGALKQLARGAPQNATGPLATRLPMISQRVAAIRRQKERLFSELWVATLQRSIAVMSDTAAAEQALSQTVRSVLGGTPVSFDASFLQSVNGWVNGARLGAHLEPGTRVMKGALLARFGTKEDAALPLHGDAINGAYADDAALRTAEELSRGLLQTQRALEAEGTPDVPMSLVGAYNALSGRTFPEGARVTRAFADMAADGRLLSRAAQIEAVRAARAEVDAARTRLSAPRASQTLTVPAALRGSTENNAAAVAELSARIAQIKQQLATLQLAQEVGNAVLRGDGSRVMAAVDRFNAFIANPVVTRPKQTADRVMSKRAKGSATSNTRDRGLAAADAIIEERARSADANVTIASAARWASMALQRMNADEDVIRALDAPTAPIATLRLGTIMVDEKQAKGALASATAAIDDLLTSLHDRLRDVGEEDAQADIASVSYLPDDPAERATAVGGASKKITRDTGLPMATAIKSLLTESVGGNRASDFTSGESEVRDHAKGAQLRRDVLRALPDRGAMLAHLDWIQRMLRRPGGAQMVEEFLADLTPSQRAQLNAARTGVVLVDESDATAAGARARRAMVYADWLRAMVVQRVLEAQATKDAVLRKVLLRVAGQFETYAALFDHVAAYRAGEVVKAMYGGASKDGPNAREEVAARLAEAGVMVHGSVVVPGATPGEAVTVRQPRLAKSLRDAGLELDNAAEDSASRKGEGARGVSLSKLLRGMASDLTATARVLLRGMESDLIAAARVSPEVTLSGLQVENRDGVDVAVNTDEVRDDEGRPAAGPVLPGGRRRRSAVLDSIPSGETFAGAARARTELAKRFGEKNLSRWEESGRLKFIQDGDALPAGMDPTDKGYYLDGVVYINPKNVGPSNVYAVFLHEAGVHYGWRALVNEAGAKKLLDAVKAFADSKVPAVAAEYRAVVDALRDLGYDENSPEFAEEVIAHLVEREAQALNRSPATRGIIERVLDAMRAAVLRIGFRPSNPRDLLALAEGALSKETTPPPGGKRSPEMKARIAEKAQAAAAAPGVTVAALDRARAARRERMEQDAYAISNQLRAARTVRDAIPILARHLQGNPGRALNDQLAGVVRLVINRARAHPNAPFVMSGTDALDGVRQLVAAVAAQDPALMGTVRAIRSRAHAALLARAGDQKITAAEREYLPGGRYHAETDDEVFLGRALTDPETQVILRSIRYERTSLMDTLTDSLRRLFGISDAEQNVFTELLRAVTQDDTPPGGGRASKNLNLPPKDTRSITPDTARAEQARARGALTKLAGAIRDFPRPDLALLSFDQLDEIFGNQFPAVAKLYRAFSKVEVAATAHMEKPIEIIHNWQMWQRNVPAHVAKALNDVMLGATFARIYIDRDYTTVDAFERAHPWHRGNVDAWNRYRALHSTYVTQLDDAGRDIYRDVSNYYADTNKRLKTAALALVTGRTTPGPDRDAEVANVNRMFRAAEEGPYFPLMRFGDFVVEGTYVDANGVEQRFNYAFETSADAAAAVAEANAELARLVNSGAIRSATKAEYRRISKAIQASDFQLTTPLLEAMYKRMRTSDENANRELKNQLYMVQRASSREGGVLARSMRREYVEGASANMLRAFAKASYANAHYLSRTQNAIAVSDAMSEVGRMLSTIRGSDPEYDKVWRLHEELHKRYQIYVAPPEASTAINKAADYTNRTTAMWLLTSSVSYPVINATQTAVFTMPELAKRHGVGESTGALVSGMWDARSILAKPWLSRSIAGIADLTGSSSMADWARKTNVDMRDAIERSDLAPDEKALLIRGLEEGHLDVSLMFDAMGAMDPRSAAGNTLVRMSNLLATLPHTSEVMNRMASALAAYRLQKAKTPGAEALNSNYAWDVVRRSHYNYGELTRSRALTAKNYGENLGPAMRVLLQFQSFALNSIFRVAREGYLGALRPMLTALSGKDATPAEREAAQQARAFLGTQATTLILMAGAFALPFLASLFDILDELADMFDKWLGGDNDAPSNMRRALYEWAAGNDGALDGERGLRQMIADGVLYGAPAGANITSLQGRIGLHTLLPGSTDSPGAPAPTLLDHLASKFPSGALYLKASRAAHNVVIGQYDLAAIDAAPKGVSDVLKAARGHTTSAAHLDSPDFDTVDRIVQRLGFTPMVSTRFYEQNAAQVRREKDAAAVVATKVDALQAAFSEVVRNPDDRAAMEDFRAKYAALNKHLERNPYARLYPSVEAELRQIKKPGIANEIRRRLPGLGGANPNNTGQLADALGYDLEAE